MLPGAQRVLLVDGGPIGDAAVVEVADALQLAGFTVRITGRGELPGDAAARFRPDVAVVSLAATDRNDEAVGAVVHTLQSDHGVPVVVVETGSTREPAMSPRREMPVVTRLASVLRDNPRSSPTLEAGDVVVDEAGRLALRADEPLDLTRLEFDLLAYLVRNRNRVVTREALLTSVWHNVPVTPNAIEALVSKLRSKLEQHGPRLVHTVRGVGYVLRVEGASPFDLRRHSLLTQRDRLLRQRDEVLARREEVRRARQAGEARDRPVG